jgi:hypothetical protein
MGSTASVTIRAFTAAFRRDSRLVLVLARKKRGETKGPRKNNSYK